MSPLAEDPFGLRNPHTPHPGWRAAPLSGESGQSVFVPFPDSRDPAPANDYGYGQGAQPAGSGTP